MSKFSLEVLNRTVFPYFKSADADVIMGAVFGEDVALTRVDDDILVSHLDPIVGAVHQIGWLAVHVACNDIATSGAPPRWAQLLVLVPSKEDESLLAQIMADVKRAVDEIGVTVIGGHTGYSASLSRPLVAVTALGILHGQAPVLTRGAQPGDHILITKGMALEGTAILAHDFAVTARKLGLTADDIAAAKVLMAQVSVVPEALLLAKHGASAMHDVTRGGLLETLLEMAALSEVRMTVSYEQIPIPPVASRFAAAFGFEPLKMISSGTLAAAVPAEKLEIVRNALDTAGIHFADIGEVQLGQGVLVVRKEMQTHIKETHPEADELARMWEVYTPDASV